VLHVRPASQAGRLLMVIHVPPVNSVTAKALALKCYLAWVLLLCCWCCWACPFWAQ